MEIGKQTHTLFSKYKFIFKSKNISLRRSEYLGVSYHHGMWEIAVYQNVCQGK